MKLLLTTAIILMVLSACNNSTDSTAKKENITMTGAYNLLSQSLKGGTSDTAITTLKQQKVFVNGYMMYANFNPPDSASAFGIGTYSADADTVTEHVIYNASGSYRSDTAEDYKLVISKTANGYKQIIPEIISQGQKYVLTEEYDSLATAAGSALDGAWKQDNEYYIKGKDTSRDNSIVQYKLYGAGYFVWGHTYADSVKKVHTGIGYGKFELNGNKLKETVAVSTYADIRGVSFDISLVMNGADSYTQTIVYKDSSRQVEIYKRLK